ncbi:MAG: GIY-YIG nuclease family protein [Clostridia bacterium]|nr:GIY-YIG nuclease family protein [Clostridia bacterium]
MYYTYMLRCLDNSIYTGMTNDIEKRIEKHKKGKGAKYTKSHHAEKIEAVWRSKEKSLACKLEYQIKQLTKKQKEDLINGAKLSGYFKGKIDCRRYYKIKRVED